MSWKEAVNNVKVDELIRLAELDKKDSMIDLFDRYDEYVKRQKDPRLLAGFIHQVVQLYNTFHKNSNVKC